MHYDNSYKHEAVELAKEIWVKNTSARLGLSYGAIYGWYAKSIRAGQNICNSDGTTYVLNPEIKNKRIPGLEKSIRSWCGQMNFWKRHQGFSPEKIAYGHIPNTVWGRQITYFANTGCFDGSVLALKMRDNMKKTFVSFSYLQNEDGYSEKHYFKICSCLLQPKKGSVHPTLRVCRRNLIGLFLRIW